MTEPQYLVGGRIIQSTMFEQSGDENLDVIAILLWAILLVASIATNNWPAIILLLVFGSIWTDKKPAGGHIEDKGDSK